MPEITFTDMNGLSHSIPVTDIDDIFGFNTASSDEGLLWYYWVCTKDRKVIKSKTFTDLEAARAEYSELKLKFERAAS